MYKVQVQDNESGTIIKDLENGVEGSSLKIIGGIPAWDDPAAKSIMVLLAHPDDDTFIGGILKQLVDSGHSVHVFYTTSGKYGTDVRGIITDPDELGLAREAEAVAALALLGIPIGNLHALREDDAGTDEDALMIALNTNLGAGVFVPDIVLTFSYTGLYGHEEHKTVNRLGTQYYRQNVTCESIFYFDVPLSDRIRSVAPEAGGDLTWNFTTLESNGVNDMDVAYTYILTAAELQARKDAIAVYVTQFDATRIAQYQGHIDVRPFEYMLHGTAKSGNGVNQTDNLINLFKLV